MLTLCPRCRTPYDRRAVAGHALPQGDAVLCAACADGRLADTRAPRRLELVTGIVGGAPERLVLPVAS
jgi:hypothetical protein